MNTKEASKLFLDFQKKISDAWAIFDDESVAWLEKERRDLSEAPERLCVKRLSDDATLPTRGTEKAAGIDLYSADDIIVEKNSQSLIRTGVSISLPDGYVGLIWPRSGIAYFNGIDTMAGVIDSDYSGEVSVLLRNHGASPFKVRQGMRVAQLVVQKYEKLPIVEVSELPATSRGQNGFGSTGS